MNTVNITTETDISVRFLENVLATEGSQCVEFEFFVTGMNDAGIGQTVRIFETVPICELEDKYSRFMQHLTKYF